jgi:peptide deformylase
MLDIHVLGSPVLRSETTLVSDVGAEFQRLVDDMFETMYAAQGIGLAAPQVGRGARVAIVDVENNPLVLVNPEVVVEEGTDRAEEGCLSIPDIYGEVERAERVTVRALDRKGQEFTIDAAGLLARAIQHEIDHLHGKLFIDYLSFLKRRAALSKWDSMKEQYPALIRRIVVPETSRASSHHSAGGIGDEVL